jgi:hypothetical protein
MQIKHIGGNCKDILDDPFKDPYSPTTTRGAKIPIIVTKANKNENAVPINLINMGPDIKKDVITSEKC